MKLKSARWEPRLALYENGELVDVAPLGRWQCAGEWAESILPGYEVPFFYVGANADGTEKTYKVDLELLVYRMEVTKTPR